VIVVVEGKYHPRTTLLAMVFVVYADEKEIRRNRSKTSFFDFAIYYSVRKSVTLRTRFYNGFRGVFALKSKFSIS